MNTITAGRIERIEAECGVVFNGIQERVAKSPVYLWTDTKTGSTFATFDDDLTHVQWSAVIMRAKFGTKPGMFHDAKDAAWIVGILGSVAVVTLWVGRIIGAW